MFGTPSAGSDTDFTQDISVPTDAITGNVRMRILTGDAWTYASGAPTTTCGFHAASSTKDFNIEIQSNSVASTTITFTSTTEDLHLTEGAEDNTDAGTYSITTGATETLTSITGASGTATNIVAGGDTRVEGTYGYLVVTGQGYVYTLDNSRAATLALAAGDMETETFIFTLSATITNNLEFTITGVNTDAMITGVLTGAITEDAPPNTVGGTATNTDSDNQNNIFREISTPMSSTYGEYTIEANGAWTYTLDNENGVVNALNISSTDIEDTLTIQSEDGTEGTITITISGANDAAIITGATSGSMTRTTASVNGDLDHTDVDNTNDLFTEISTATSSTYGEYTITTDGAWTYTLNQTNQEVIDLSGNETLDDSFTVTSTDGTPQLINITITANNAQTISPTVPASVDVGDILSIELTYTSTVDAIVSIELAKYNNSSGDYVDNSQVAYKEKEVVAGTRTTMTITIDIPASTNPTSSLTGESYKVKVILVDRSRSNSLATHLKDIELRILPAPDISIRTSTLIAKTGSVISDIFVDSSAGGSITGYSIAPPIGNGLSFDTTTGIIYGTPTAVAQEIIYTITATNAAGQTATATVSITVVSSLGNEDFEKIGFSVSPNPTGGILNITVDEKADYRLLNIRGQVLKKGVSTKGESKINIYSLARGVYFLNIKTGKGSFTEKIVKN